MEQKSIVKYRGHFICLKQLEERINVTLSVLTKKLPFLVMAAAAMQPASRGQMMRATREQIRGWMTPTERMYSVQVYSTVYKCTVQ